MAIDVSKPDCPENNIEMLENIDETSTNNSQLVSKFDKNMINLIIAHEKSLQKQNELKHICENWDGTNKPGIFNIKKLDFFFETSIVFKNTQFIYKKFLAHVYTLTHLCGANLESLSIPFECDTEILKIIKQHCPNLKYLHLPFIRFNDNKLTQVFTSLKQLNHLSIGNELSNGQLKLDNFMEAIKNLPDSLTELCLSLSFKIHNPFQPPPGSLALVLENLNNLKTLRMIMFKLSMKDMIVISQLETLKKLDLNCSTVIEPRSMDLICNIDNLEYFESDCDEIDDEFLINLANGCKKLKGLTIDNTFGLTDAGIIELTKLKYFNSLAIYPVGKLFRIPCVITDESIGKFKNLKRLIVGHIKGITDKSIKKILDYSPELEELDTTDTSTTMQIYQHAANVTKNRTNNIKLRYSIFEDFDDDEYDYLCNLEKSSPFLVLDIF